jgi:hypothetical protein
MLTVTSGRSLENVENKGVDSWEWTIQNIVSIIEEYLHETYLDPDPTTNPRTTAENIAT